MLTSKNNFIFAPVKLNYCKDNDGKVTKKHIQFYSSRAKHVGFVTYEPLYLDKNIRELPAQLGIDNEDKIDGLKELNSIIHNLGAKTIAHLNHPGRMANPNIPNNYLVSATDKSCPSRGGSPKKMDMEDIQKAIDLFVNAAVRAQKANFDAIELQFGYGYLVAQFLSKSVNNRTDEYGGDFENRARFALRVFDEVSKAVDLPIFVRMTGSEIILQGIELNEAIQLAKILKQKGVEAVHIVTGSVCDTPPWFFQHMFVPKGKTWELAKKIKEETGVAIVSVGRINSLEDVKKLNESDYIALARPLVADPDAVGKLLGIVEGPIRPCLACSDSCIDGVRSGRGLECVVNPTVGMESINIEPTEIIKNIAIVGAGLSGLEAAIQLNKRGHKVTIYEKNEVGGQFNLAWLPPKKDSLLGIINYYKQEIEKNNINMIYKTADSSEILAKGYDEVIIATGAKPIQPSIKGLDVFNWADILSANYCPLNQKILIIGGGLIGLEIANKFIVNNKIVIIEALDEVGRGMEMMEKKLTLQNLKEHNAQIITNHKVIEVKDKGRTVILEGEKVSFINDIDLIITTIGMVSDNKLYAELEGKVPVYLIGDALLPSNARNAILNGFNIGIKL